MTEAKLTSNESRVVGMLAQAATSGAPPPSSREFMRELGYRSPRSVTQLLDQLERKGYIRRGLGARNVALLKRPASMDMETTRRWREVSIQARLLASAIDAALRITP